MERAPPPSLAAAALAEMDELLMDTPLSPKRPRPDDTPSQVGAGAATPRPRTTANSARTDIMVTTMLDHNTHLTFHSHTHHTPQAGHTNREGLRAWPLHCRGTALVLVHEGPARRHQKPNPSEGWHTFCNTYCSALSWTQKVGAGNNECWPRMETPEHVPKSRGGSRHESERKTRPPQAAMPAHSNTSHKGKEQAEAQSQSACAMRQC